MKIVAVLYPGNSFAKSCPELLGCAENCLGLREKLEKQGNTVIALTDRETELESQLPSTDILVTTPFWPAYITRERIEKAPNLRLILTAGVGSDHIDLAAAAENNITVAEITGSNVVSVAEHVVMQILALVRNYFPAYHDVINGGWNIGEIAAKSHDLESKSVGIIGQGRIGQRVAIRLKPFDVKLYYYDYRHLSTVDEAFLNIQYLPLHKLVSHCDVISINCPLTPATKGLFDFNLLSSMKKGAYLINTARGAIVDTNALVKIMNEGHLAGYAGDVWYPQPAPADHPWRSMPNHAMTPHIAGTPLEAQKRYADGIYECITSMIKGDPIDQDYLIVDKGEVVSPSYKYAYVKKSKR